MRMEERNKRGREEWRESINVYVNREALLGTNHPPLVSIAGALFFMRSFLFNLSPHNMGALAP